MPSFILSGVYPVMESEPAPRVSSDVPPQPYVPDVTAAPATSSRVAVLPPAVRFIVIASRQRSGQGSR